MAGAPAGALQRATARRAALSESESVIPKQKKRIPTTSEEARTAPFPLLRKLRYTPFFFLHPNEPTSLGFAGDPI